MDDVPAKAPRSPTDPSARASAVAEPSVSGVIPTCAVIIAIAAGGWTIVAARSFIIPLVLAVFAFVLVRALDRLWHRIPFVGRNLNSSMTTALSAALIVSAGVGVVNLVSDNVAGVTEAAPVYEKRLTELADRFDARVARVLAWIEPGSGDDEIAESPGPGRGDSGRGDSSKGGSGEEDSEEGAADGAESIPATSGTPAAPDGDDRKSMVDRLVDWLDLQGLAATFGAGFLSIAGNVALVLVYLFFLLLEQPFFDRKLRAMVRDDEKREDYRALLSRIDRDVSVYLGVKTFVSLLTALPAYLIMLAVGLDFAEFWAVVIFALNFIPNVGSAIATVLPATIALLQFDTLRPFWTVAIGLTAVQLFVANVVEPNLLGRRLNMSPLVVIVALVGWSLLWGVPGAFLCVPMTNILILVLANLASTRWLAILLSRDGNIAEEAAA